MSEAENARWYVVHTYSGYENKVKADIEKTKENRNLQDQILEVVVPVEDATEMKNGKPKSIERKILPGYVLINMVMNDVTWYVVRNTSGVTGFIGSSGGGAKPFPLQKGEIDPILRNMGIKSDVVNIDFGVGDHVRVVDGPLKDKEGKVDSIDMTKQEAKVLVDMLGTLVSMEVDLALLEKVEL